MKASEALQKLEEIGVHGWRQSVRSKIDETKCLPEMLQSWINLFRSYPDMRIGSITKYNINRDFDCL